MRIDPCPDCSNHVNINSDHAMGCPRRQGAVYFRDDGTPVMEGDKHYCVICGDEFDGWLDTVDHGHDSHGLYHFQNPTVAGSRPPDFDFPLSYEQQYDRAERWAQEAWRQT
jgi:hypothetical protein